MTMPSQGRTRSRRQETLLESVSPYGSRRLTVSCDGVTTAAFLHDEITLRHGAASRDSAVIALAWVANHRPAPPGTVPGGRPGHAGSPGPAGPGKVPLMPAAHTRLPGGCPPPDPAALEVVWFEEGDGVAVAEDGRLLTVIPGWSCVSRAMPGYSRDVIGQTPIGWSLYDAMEGLGPRVDEARSHWQWRRDTRSWDAFQHAALAHLTSRLGHNAHYWDASAGRQPAVSVAEYPPTRGRPYTVLATVGMCCQRMPVVEQHVTDTGRYARIELAMATTLPPLQAARAFLWLAPRPWQAVMWFGHGRRIRWQGEPGDFPLGAGRDAVLFLDDPAMLGGPRVPDLSGFSFGWDPVRWLWVVPVSERGRGATARGPVSTGELGAA